MFRDKTEISDSCANRFARTVHDSLIHLNHRMVFTKVTFITSIITIFFHSFAYKPHQGQCDFVDFIAKGYE